MAPDKMDKKDISSFMKFICKTATLNSYKVKEKKKEEKKNEKKK